MAKSLTVVAGAPPVEFLTITELAKACGNRSKSSLLQLIAKGLMPDANYRTLGLTHRKGSRAGEKTEGTRLYSKEYLVPKLLLVFAGIRQGTQITAEQITAFGEAFVAEKNYFANVYGRPE